MDPELFTATQLALLAHERAYDLITTTTLLSSLAPSVLSRQHGLAILNLCIASQRTGLGGNTLIDLELDSAVSSGGGNSNGTEGAKLPAHTIRPGDIVRVEEQAAGGAKRKVKTELGEKGVEGVVSRVTETRVTVAIGKGKGGKGGDDDGDLSAVDKLLLSTSGNSRLWVVKVSNDTTYLRMERAMDHLLTLHNSSRLSTLHRILLGLDKPSPPAPESTLQFFDESLNPSQRAAVAFALASPEIALIHGPPGTGKTHTLIELILQLATKQNKRVLVCGPSNISVDNIILRLPSSVPAIRIGHPARLLPGVLNQSLDVLTQTSDAADIVKDVRKDMDTKLAQLNASGKERLKGSARKEGWAEFRELRREFRERENRCLRELLRTSKVVVATMHGAGSSILRGERFDIGVIDEGSQALEAQCWIPILHNIDGLGGGIRKLVIAGDHLQLPPTVKSESLSTKKASLASAKGGVKLPPNLPPNIPTSLTTTLFSRLLSLYGQGIKRLLTTQYRMHQSIMAFPSLALYDNKLIADDSVKTHLLRDLPGVEDTEDTREPVIFYDTQGGEFPESVAEEDGEAGGLKGLRSESKSNPGEVLVVLMHLHNLLRSGIRMEDVAVITPYTAQLALLSQAMRSGNAGGGGGGPFEVVELGSIDGFQGREKEVVVLSLVRSNEERETGFLREERRLNVAATRARRSLVVVGDGETLRGRSSGGGGEETKSKSKSKERKKGNNVEGKEDGDFLKRWMDWLDGEGDADVRYVSFGEATRGAEGN